MREKIDRFMQGRYGTDKLNQFIFYLVWVFLIVSKFTKNRFFTFLFYLDIVLYLYRSLSKNYVKRSIENQKFIHVQAVLGHHIQALCKNIKDKEHKYFVCPKCTQLIRVPKKRGKITVTCPSCRKSFDAKS